MMASAPPIASWLPWCDFPLKRGGRFFIRRLRPAAASMYESADGRLDRQIKLPVAHYRG
jgi:hypothetical protein